MSGLHPPFSAFVPAPKLMRCIRYTRSLTEDLRRLQEENARLHHQLKARAVDGTRHDGPTPVQASTPQGARPVLPSLSSHLSDAGGQGWREGEVKPRRNDDDERKFRGEHGLSC